MHGGSPIDTATAGGMGNSSARELTLGTNPGEYHSILVRCNKNNKKNRQGLGFQEISRGNIASALSVADLNALLTCGDWSGHKLGDSVNLRQNLLSGGLKSRKMLKRFGQGSDRSRVHRRVCE
jgi:hypothetical protein